MKKQAFTLVEILVVVGITGILIVSVAGIMGSFFKAKNRTDTSELIQTTAAKVMEKIKANVLEASGDINCFSGVGETGIIFETSDGGETRIYCDYLGNKIASESAHGSYNLFSEGVVITDCSDFVNCTTLPSTEISLINFKFSLGVAGGDLGEYNWTFNSKVAPRH